MPSHIRRSHREELVARVELGLTSEDDTLFCARDPRLRAGHDQAPFEFGKTSENGKDQLSMRGRRVTPRVGD
jgi:hypothetical protein